jgi:uncharacterized protein (TIGR03437 family)
VTFRALVVSLALVASARAQLSVVSAASYQPIVAPESLASIFGSNLALSTASATPDANGNLPNELASTRVEFNGTPASLIYVSPTQINFVVPAGLAAGTTSLVVVSTDTNTARTAAVQVAGSAPAIFTTNGSGSGPGAILNTVTFLPAPFLTVTIQNGAETQTRLAVFGTGFRFAANITATAIDFQSNRFNLVVEYAGPAPGFPGLDQLNFVVPAGLDGAGNVSLTIATEDAVSNTVTFLMNLLPADLLKLTSIVLNPSLVNGGDTITATIGLNGIARAGGFLVNLRSTNLAAPITSFITIPPDNATWDVPVFASFVISVQTGAIIAQAGTVIVSANFEIDPANQVRLSSLSVTPTSTLGGRALQATISLTARAPAGGLIVQLASNNAAARPPAAMVVPFDQASVSFQIPTVLVASPQPVTISATLNRDTVTSNVTVLPLFSIGLDPNPVTGGMAVTGSITLADPAPPGGVTFALSSTDAGTARVPAILTIFANQTFGTFNITTSTVPGSRTVNISAAYLGITATATLTVNPPPAPVLIGLSISPNTITGGLSTQGTVTLAAPAPAGGIIVNLFSSSLLTAQVPGFVIVQQGFTNAIFTVNTTRVPVAQSVTISASAGGIIKAATLTVQ